MIRTWLVVGTMLTAASAATAQVSVGNPPGNTVAPATGSVGVGPSTPSPTQPGDLAHAATPELAAEKYKTEVVCKTSVQTGSLIAKRKVCLTRKQWQYVNDENERTARDYVHDNTSKSGGGPN